MILYLFILLIILFFITPLFYIERTREGIPRQEIITVVLIISLLRDNKIKFRRIGKRGIGDEYYILTLGETELGLYIDKLLFWKYYSLRIEGKGKNTGEYEISGDTKLLKKLELAILKAITVEDGEEKIKLLESLHGELGKL